jgi:beta-lactamase class A
MPAPTSSSTLALLLAALLAGCANDRPSDPEAGARPATTTPGIAEGAPQDAAEPPAGEAPAWTAPLRAQLARIDEDTAGAVGVFVHHLGDGGRVAHAADRPWYLSSTVKVPVAIAVLQSVEQRELSLDDQVVLQQSDFVDGAGDIIWQEPGTRYSVATLIEKSIVDSDSTATDMLVRLIGEDTLNARIAEWLPDGGFGPITTILQVRYDAYGELHPGVAGLDNMELVKLRNADAGAPRLAALVEALGVPASELKMGSIDEAFERYYGGPKNSATLLAFGTLLEKLVRRELLSDAHTELLLGHMRGITTGDRRISAGLPRGTRFAQKTGTQLARACNMGVIDADGDAPIVIAACVEKYDALPDAERAFQAIGEALGEHVLSSGRGR